MSNGYLAAAAADLSVGREIGDGFGLELIGAGALGDQEAACAALAGAANIGLILSLAAAQDEAFVALLRDLVQRAPRAQLILVEPEARAAFAFLPEAWPAMSLDEARTRAQDLLRQREAPAADADEAPHAHPLPPVAQEAPAPKVEEHTAEQAPVEQEPTQDAEKQAEQLREADAPSAPDEGERASGELDEVTAGKAPVRAEAENHAEALGGGEAEPAAPPPAEEAPAATSIDNIAPTPEAPVATAPDTPPPADLKVEAPSPLAVPEPQPPPAAAPPSMSEKEHRPAPMAPAPEISRMSTQDEARRATRGAPAQASAPADATAFAPKKLRRGTPELVRIAIHQPKDLQAVIKAARKIDPRAESAPQGMSIGKVALGASVGVSLEVRGAACEGTLQRRTWAGEPIDFSFSAEADAEVKQAVFLARVFVDDAQIGVLAFTRSVSGPAKKTASTGERVRLKRHKRVFLSYSSQDREVVSAIATAYQMAGVAYFWDRTSLKSGEQWHPRLRREIDRADLFHMCWSKSAAASEWVEKEAAYALTRRRRNNGKKPDITVQMLDGPPWAAHPPALDSINFDDFVRAAIVGYARGEE